MNKFQRDQQLAWEEFQPILEELPLLLRETMLDAKAFIRAVKEGYIVKGDEGVRLKWMLGSQTLLAYFCGRLWSGDKGQFSRRKGRMVWQTGTGIFPDAQLSRLFGSPALKQTRYRRRDLVLPAHHELVDRLFEESQEHSDRLFESRQEYLGVHNGRMEQPSQYNGRMERGMRLVTDGKGGER